MFYLCPICQQSIRSFHQRCPSCGRLFDPAEWPEEAYSSKGMRPKLKIVLGNEQVYEPSSLDFQIGRNPDGDGLVLDGDGDRPLGVSGKHARVYYSDDDGEWHVQKVGNRQLFLDGKEIDEGIISPNSKIDIGSFQLGVLINYEQYGAIAPKKGTLLSANEIILDEEHERIYIGSNSYQCKLLISEADECHALIYKHGSDWFIVDCASRSGVKVNDKRIRNEKLFPGDEISIAGVDFIFDGDRIKQGPLSTNGLELSFKGANAVVSKGLQVLVDLNFSIASGEFVGVLGPSGCGKSSLIQRVAGLANFTDGEFTVNGNSIEDVRESFQDLTAYQPQQNTLHSDLTLQEEFSCYSTIHAVSGQKISDEQILKALRLVGLESEINKKISSLSGGQQRRAGIALALLRDPQLLILDEPTSGLDPATETEVMEYLKRISNQNKTVICSTHIMENIDLFDKILVLSKGYMVFWGTPSDLINYFGISEPMDLYRIFASGDKDDQIQTAFEFSQKYNNSSLVQKYFTPQKKSNPPPKKKTLFTKQILGYWKRDFYEALSFKNDDKKIRSFFASPVFIQLIFQPFLVACVLKCACAYKFTSKSDLKEVLFFAFVAVFWLGINNSVRELVRERVPWRCLERLERISVHSYLISKFSWATFCCILQSMVFCLFLFLLPQFSIKDGSQESFLRFNLDLYLVLTLICITGAWMGLFVSSIFKKENSAVSLLPIILIPVLFFSQPIIRNSNYSEGIFFKNLNNNNDDGKYSSFAVLLEKINPCHAPEVLMDRVNTLNQKESSDNEVAIKDRKSLIHGKIETLSVIAFYMLASILLTIVFQNKKESQWKGR